jgi:hypothetical protein
MILEFDEEMSQSVLILPLSWNVPTLPSSQVTEMEVKQNPENVTSRVVAFSMIVTRG